MATNSPEPSISDDVAAEPSHEAPLEAPAATPPSTPVETPLETPADISNDDISGPQSELDLVRQEKAALENQYKALLGKLTTMRNTLGDKLRQDADELDRREQQIALLQNQLEDLTATVDTLREELITAHEDCESAHSEAEKLRTRALSSQRSHANEYTEREEALQQARQDIEDSRLAHEELERELVTQASLKEEAEDAAAAMKSRLKEVEQTLYNVKAELAQESESVGNLQSVLEEFQLGKEAEIQRTLGEVQARLSHLQVTASTYQERAKLAEEELRNLRADRDSMDKMKQELREKNGIIGKLRHEGVILNEHLTDAVRKLKRDSAEHSVDGRLITNVLLAFITTPRGDTKRFEMLSVLASVLSWSDDQREQVGLQRTAANGPGAKSRGHLVARTPADRKGHSRSSGQGSTGDTLGENDTFSSLFIEFLLKESLRHDSSTSKSLHLSTMNGEDGSVRSFDQPPSPGSTLSRRSDTTLQ